MAEKRTPKKRTTGSIKRGKIKGRPLKNKTYKKSTFSKKKLFASLKKTKNSKQLIGKIILWFLGLCVLGLVLIWFVFLLPLPHITEIENEKLIESSIIYDREGNELYNLYQEGGKRRYVVMDEISQNMIDAIISTEDKRFYENPGFDVIGLARAGISYALRQSNRIAGTSTISQQLMKLTFLTSERSISRKIKEVYLAWQLNNYYEKDKILELYLNRIPFGHNAHGIEQASQTFFAKHASELSILESSLLASLPKGPTRYSPYNNKNRLMGYGYLFPIEDENTITYLDTDDSKEQYKAFLDAFINQLQTLEFTNISANDVRVCGINKDFLKKGLSVKRGCITFDYNDLLKLLNTFQIKGTDIGLTNSNLVFEYQTGRKDIVLQRMLKDTKINATNYIDSIVESLHFNFAPYKEDIKAPHFVFHVREQIVEQYGEEFLSQGGVKIYTTLDPDLQQKAEEVVAARAEANAINFGAKNAALVSLDNKTGEILALVGNADYFDDENNGQVNVITSKKQPGSSFKPLVYALAFANSTIGPKTPVWDIETEFDTWKPKNFDGEWKGQMTIENSLGYSRNIPAAKMFYHAGGERAIINHVQKLGIESIQYGNDYGAPLAIGSAEATPLELATAYMTLANGGYKNEIQSIIKIVDTEGNIIFDASTIEKESEKAFSTDAAYLTNRVLSNTATRPAFWNNYMTLADGRQVAAKTGTSNKDETPEDADPEDERQIRPRDLWMVGYTPNITTVVWSGNTNGEGTWPRGNGLEASGPIWKSVMDFAHKNIQTEVFTRPSTIESKNISVTSGKLAGKELSHDYIASSLFANGNTPKKVDTSGNKTIKVDALCNGQVTRNTPKSAIVERVVVDLDGIVESIDSDWLEDIYEYIETDEGKDNFPFDTSKIITSFTNEPCFRPDEWEIEIGSNLVPKGIYSHTDNFVQVGYKSTHPIANIEILQDNDLINKKIYSGEVTLVGVYQSNNINFNEEHTGKSIVTIRATDIYGYSERVSYTVSIGDQDTIAPTITITEGDLEDTVIIEDSPIALKIKIHDGSALSSVNIYINNEVYKSFGDKRLITLAFDPQDVFEIGPNSIIIEATDSLDNTATKTIEFTYLGE